MAKPSSTSSGKLVIPLTDFHVWCNSMLPEGPYYAFGKTKEKGADLEIDFNSSTDGTPTPPA